MAGTDYEIIRNWWLVRGLNSYVVPMDCLPPTGVVVVSGGVLCCAAWIHVDKYSCSGLIGNVVTNPDIGARLRVKSIEICFDRLIVMAGVEGVKSLVAHFAENGLLTLLKRRGFSQHPVPMREVERRIS
jgi:hypothetical protein